MNIHAWIFTDPHINHPNLITKGYRPADYEDRLRISWDKNVESEGTVFCLGDVAMKQVAAAHTDFIMKRPGYKILILGNHDEKPEAWYKERGWDEVWDKLVLEFPIALLKRTLYGYVGCSNWFARSAEWIEEPRILLSHIPQIDDGTFDLNIHGHYHNSSHRADTDAMVRIRSYKHRLLALECVDYQLVRLSNLITGAIHETGRPIYEYEATGMTCLECQTSELLAWSGGDQAYYCRTCDSEESQNGRKLGMSAV